MKTTLPTCALALAALLAGTAMAGDPAHGPMRSDTDGDGRVSRAEAAAASAERSGEWFDKLDLDKDGYVTQEEMKQARETRHKKMRAEKKERMDAHFQNADTNSDGSLSLDEVQANMPRLAERFSTIDQEHNGLLSKDELKQARSKHRKPQPQS
jgi:Ca2+-binding EF-hand superfamily protein